MYFSINIGREILLNNFDYDSDEWQFERDIALEQADYTCQRCGRFLPKFAHVHHVYGTNYRKYEVLCADCHADHHGNDEIREFDTPYENENWSDCKYCGDTIEWDNNLPYNLDGTKHDCKIIKCKKCNKPIEFQETSLEYYIQTGKKYLIYNKNNNSIHKCQKQRRMKKFD